MTSRRGRGEDSVYLDGDRWRGAASLGYWPDGRRIRKKVSGATKAEVMHKLRELRAELNAGMPMPDDRLTVAAFLDRWLTASLPGQVSEKTFDSYADTVRLHITPSLGRKGLRKLTVSDVDQLLAWKRNAGYSANTVRIIRAVLRRAQGKPSERAWFHGMRPLSPPHRAFGVTKGERSRLTRQGLSLNRWKAPEKSRC